MSEKRSARNVPKSEPPVPQPEDPFLRNAATQVALLGPETHGLTLGYGINVVEGYFTVRLLRHELRHVYQYEQAGSIEGFLAEYIPQVLQFGYEHAPFEVDARAYESG